MKFENTQVTNFENAAIGMRLPMCKDFAEAQQKTDLATHGLQIGGKDLDLMKRLINADKSASGQPNSKFLRMIHVQVAITAPLYWWKEADTYKIATVTNSTSTMHRIANCPITQNCFEIPIFEETLKRLESARLLFNETKDKDAWKQLIVNLPESWLQTRMFDCNYATLRNIYHQRKNHKLTEWHKFCEWIESLPYAKELICEMKGETEMTEKDTSEIKRLKTRIEELTQANTELEARIISLEEKNEKLGGQEPKKARGRPCVPVIAIPETGEPITFESIKEAAEELGIQPKAIQGCLKSGTASGGYCFDYAV